MEKEMVLTVAGKPKRVVVVGGGPAGLEAARVAALRGHQVILFEKEPKLGGQLNLAAIPPFKQEICLTVKYLSTQVEKAGVRLEMRKEATPELIEELKPDVVIVATGAAPLIPNIAGVQRETVFTAWDILAGKIPRHGRYLIIIGGGQVGCETADLLADPAAITRGTSVTIVEMLEAVGLDMGPEQRCLLLERLRAKQVNILTSAKVKEILADGVVFVKDGEEGTLRGKTNIILAMGAMPVNNLADKVRGHVAEVYVIGDGKEPRKALDAIAEGAEVARKI